VGTGWRTRRHEGGPVGAGGQGGNGEQLTPPFLFLGAGVYARVKRREPAVRGAVPRLAPLPGRLGTDRGELPPRGAGDPGGGAVLRQLRRLPGVSLTVSPTVSPSPCLSRRLSHCVSLTVSPTVSRTAMKESRIVTEGISGGGEMSSRGRFVTPADFPRRECSPFRGLRGTPRTFGILSIVQGPFSVAPCQALTFRFATFVRWLCR
jgi:hypothetical protein